MKVTQGACATAWAMLLIGVAAPAWGQQAQPDLPGNLDPGAQRERSERDLPGRGDERDDATDDEDPVEGPAGPEGGNLPESDDAFTLDGVRFSESEFLDEAYLESVAADYVDRPVTFSELNRMLGRINTRYRERGIVTAAAYIPPQEIEDGILQVELLEGRLAELRIEGADYTNPDFIRGRLAASPGEVIDVPRLRQSINRFNRNTSVALRAGIEPGAETGQSDISIRVQEPPRYQPQVFLDNSGSSTTGEWRTGVVLGVNGPLGRADRLTAYAVYGEGAQNALLRYEVPVNRHGGRLDLSYSLGEIQVIDGPFEELDITGESSEASIGFRQPVYSGDLGNLVAHVGYSDSESISEIAGTTISDFRIGEAEVGLEWSGTLDNARWRVSQDYKTADVEALNADTETHARYPGSASWLQGFTPEWSGQLRLDWQFADTENLPSSLVYQLGGTATVRGYEEGVVSGGVGYRLSASADYRWSSSLSQTAFLDYGEVDQGASGKTELASIGTGVTWRWTEDLSIEATLGVPLEDVTPDQDSARAHIRVTWRPSLPW